MLESMTAMQFKEWLAFFKIRNEPEGKPEGKYGASQNEQRRLSGDLLRSMTGYQQRRDTRNPK